MLCKLYYAGPVVGKFCMDLAIKKAKNEQMEKFKHQCRVKLDMMHAFGAYSGEKDFDVYGQVHIIGNSMIPFDKP